VENLLPKLRSKEIDNAKPQDKEYKLWDCNGLYLLVRKTGTKTWRWKYRMDGREYSFTFGDYPTLGLKEVREQFKEMQLLKQQGINPSKEKTKNKRERKYQNLNTFESLANDWIENFYKLKVKEVTWNKTIPYFKKEIYPVIGKIPLNELRSIDVLKAVEPISNRGAIEMAHRILRMIKRILNRAVRLEMLIKNVASDLYNELPTPEESHFDAVVEVDDFAHIVKKVWDNPNKNSIIVNCLKLHVLLFQRPSEIRSMRWKDINFETKEWRYMVGKTETPHIVPLSNQVIGILNEMQELNGKEEFVFFSSPHSKHTYISDSAIYDSMREDCKIAKDVQDPHGFRASARTILREVLGYDADMLEKQLAHKHSSADRHKGAYDRTKFINQRTEFMQIWSDFCDDIRERAS
jgi:integrase